MVSVSYCDMHLLSNENKIDSKKNQKGRSHYEKKY